MAIRSRNLARHGVPGDDYVRLAGLDPHIFPARAPLGLKANPGRALAALLLTFGCLGMYVGGRMSDHWQKRGVAEGPLKVAVISAIGTLLLMPLAVIVPSPAWTLALLAPGLFFDALAMGTAAAALQHIFPNQVRGQVSALYLFLLNLGGGSLGPLLPGVFNDYLFHDPNKVGIFARHYDRDRSDRDADRVPFDVWSLSNRLHDDADGVKSAGPGWALPFRGPRYHVVNPNGGNDQMDGSVLASPRLRRRSSPRKRPSFASTPGWWKWTWWSTARARPSPI